MKYALLSLLLFALAAPGLALSPSTVEVHRLVQLPLAVTEVVAVGVPAARVEGVVVELNRAEVPIFDTVEIVRYTPFELALRTFVPAGVAAPDVPWAVADLDMPTLLRVHLDAGLRGERLAWAVRSDLERIGFVVTAGDRWQRAPQPRHPRFVYFLEPGYAFDSRRGFFHDRVVTVDRELPGRQRLARRAGAGPRVPPGHRKHGPDGIQPTPGHVRHHVDGGPPGHAGKPGRDRAERRGKPGRGKAAKGDGKGNGQGNRGQGRGRGNGGGR